MAETIGTAYVQIEPSFDGVTPKIEQHFGGEGEKSGGSFVKGFAGVLGTVGKVAGAAVAAGATAVAGIVQSATSSFGEYQQLVGGVETLFGAGGKSLDEYAASVGKTTDEVAEKFGTMEAAQAKVMENASNAYLTAGMSANEYMETITSFAASLKQSTADELEAAQVADMAVIDMSDNANKMGTSMESIQNAYQGFAKQNYTMLDNLKLGYGGTKKEMQRLLEDAEALTGVEYDIENLSDVYNAIHVVQQELGITGTTAVEAGATITGSMASVKSAWENVLTGMGSGDADMGKLIDNLVKTTETFIGNMLPTVQNALAGVSTLIAEMAPIIAEKIPELLSQVLPGLLEAGVKIVQTLGEGLLSAIPALMPQISEILIELVNLLLSMLPQLIEVGAQVLLALATGIADALPTLIPTIIDVILTIVDYLLENIDLLVDAGIKLMTGLTLGLIQAAPVLIEKFPEIIFKLIEVIIVNGPLLVQAFIDCFMMLVNVVIQYGAQIIEAAGAFASQTFERINTWFSQLPERMAYFAGQMVGRFLTFFKELPANLEALWNKIITAVKQFGAKLVSEGPKMANDFKNKLIDNLNALPGKMVEIGKNIVQGLLNGIKNAWSNLTGVVGELASSFISGVQSQFKIGSPSKVMADEVGKWIPAGIAVGIEEGMGALNKSVDDITSTIMGGTMDANVYENVRYDAGKAEGDAKIDSLYSILDYYLPILATGGNVQVRLEGDAGRLFRMMQTENRKNIQITGQNAFA